MDEDKVRGRGSSLMGGRKFNRFTETEVDETEVDETEVDVTNFATAASRGLFFVPAGRFAHQTSTAPNERVISHTLSDVTPNQPSLVHQPSKEVYNNGSHPQVKREPGMDNLDEANRTIEPVPPPELSVPGPPNNLKLGTSSLGSQVQTLNSLTDQLADKIYPEGDGNVSSSPLAQGLPDPDNRPLEPLVRAYPAENGIPLGNFNPSQVGIDPIKVGREGASASHNGSMEDPPTLGTLPVTTHPPPLEPRQPKDQAEGLKLDAPMEGTQAVESPSETTSSKSSDAIQPKEVDEMLDFNPPQPRLRSKLLAAEKPIAPSSTPKLEFSHRRGPPHNDKSMPIATPPVTPATDAPPPIFDPRQLSPSALDNVGPTEEEAEQSVPNDDRKSLESEVVEDKTSNAAVTKKKPSKAPIAHTIQIYPKGLEARVNARIACTVVGCGLACFLIGLLGGSVAWPGLVLACGVWALLDKARIDREAIDHQLARGVALGRMVSTSEEGESAEWLNQCIDHIWRTLDPTLLNALIDVVEDSLNAALPSVVQAAHVQDLELGTQAPRITSISWFPRTTSDPSDELFGEISFDLHAYPSSTRPKLSPPHILIHLLVGIKGVAATTLPVKAQLLGLGGKARFRIRTMSKGPFLKHLDFAFTRLPRFDTAVYPLGSLNLMGLPVLSHYVKASIDLALQAFVEPRFFPMDLEALLSGDDQRHDTDAVGVLRIQLRGAVGLKRADLSGDNDAYATCSIEHGKVLSATRIITSSHPRWDETHFVPITRTALDNDLDLMLRVFDSDRLDRDDLLGEVRFRLRDIVELKGGTVFDGDADLGAQPDARKRGFTGALSLAMAYGPKFEEPPLASYPAMLGCLIYQGSNLEIVQEGYVNGDTQLPDPYAVLYVDHKPSFVTRTKLNNPAPYWNAASEHFVRDWRSATVTVVVKARLAHEHDPVVGVANVEVGKRFQGWAGGRGLEHTQWYPLEGGIGFGQVRFGFVVKPLELKLPPELTGSEVGSLVVDQIAIAQNLSVRDAYILAQLETSNLNRRTELLSANFGDRTGWKAQLLFPVEDRHQNSLVLSLKQRALLVSDKLLGQCSLRLSELLDAKVRTLTFDLALGKGSTTSDDRHASPTGDQGLTLTCRIGFFPGFSYAHREHFKSQLVALDPKLLMDRSNLVWNAPGEADEPLRALTAHPADGSASDAASPSGTHPTLITGRPPEDGVLVISTQATSDQVAKVPKSSALRSLRWGRDKLQQKVVDLTSRTRHQNRPTIDHEA
ncbi:hypothetical protein L0F63_007199 [Massospora cicadina]|nr:hypothetical protein L0F63_007199 [Massospora cicadina]